MAKHGDSKTETQLPFSSHAQIIITNFRKNLSPPSAKGNLKHNDVALGACYVTGTLTAKVRCFALAVSCPRDDCAVCF